MAAEMISQEDKIRCNAYIYEKYFTLICGLTKHYWRYMPVHMDYLDLCHDVYIRTCIVFYYPYNYKLIDQRYLITRSIIQILDTKFPKNINKVKFEQSLVRSDSSDYSNSTRQYDQYKPCEKTVMCKYHMDKLFNYIKHNLPIYRYWNKPKILNVIAFLKQKFLTYSKFTVYTLPHIIDVLANNMYLCEESKRTYLYAEYKRWHSRVKLPPISTKNCNFPKWFDTACNFFLIKIKMFFYSEGLYDYLLKSGE